jgi:hypothetical protein
MLPYHRENLEVCGSYLTRYEFRSETYYIIDNYCADFAIEPENCHCKLLQEVNPL